MTCKINKSEIPGQPLSFFDALFGRCTAFFGHFLVDVVMSEGSTRISSLPHFSDSKGRIEVELFMMLLTNLHKFADVIFE